ncbi:MAG: hypothetical protein A2297_10295 [Elusimicrobia bacterium RIFOXYB2_FULL_48_7]|nr:MAG: hypothetical protein A2297_10295 [Elusimicrobia bacterium RIFOXYB2_FULL_48_7]
MKKTIFAVFVLVLSLARVCSPDARELISKKPLYGGALTEQARSVTALADIRTADLYGDKREFIVDYSSNSFKLVRFSIGESSGQLKVEGEITTANRTRLLKEYRIFCWGAADTDNNGKDEILLFYNGILKKYEWDGAKFGETEIEFPEVIDSFITGDINNDKINEIAAFSYFKGDIEKSQEFKANFCIWNVSGGKAEKLWEDNKQLEYKNNSFIPPDRLNCISDIDNDGITELIADRGQMGATPTVYDFYVWKSTGLVFAGAKVFSKNKIYGSNEFVKKNLSAENKVPYLIGPFTVIRENRRNKIVAWCMDSAAGRPKAVAVSAGKTGFKIEKTLFSNPGDMPPPAVSWINFDGKGRGILVISPGDRKRTKITWSFYR